MDFSSESDDQLIKRTEVCVKKGDAAQEKANEWYISAGLCVSELKGRCLERGDPWKSWVEDNLAIGYRQAHRLLCLVGSDPVSEDMRAEAVRRKEELNASEAERQRKRRAAERDEHVSSDVRTSPAPSTDEIREELEEARTFSTPDPDPRAELIDKLDAIVADFNEAQLQKLIKYARKL